MRLRHLRDLLKLSEDQMAAQLVMPVERYRELEASQGDQHVSAFDVECDPSPIREPDMFNTEPVLRRLLATSNHAVKVQIEENEKLRKENWNLKRSLVRFQLSKVWTMFGGFFYQIYLGEIDYRILGLSGITRPEVDKLVAEIQEKFKEDDLQL